MRKAINENPVVQIVLIGVLGIAVAFLFMTRVMGSADGGGEPAPATPTTSPAPSTPVAGTPGTADPAAVNTGAESAAPPAGMPGFEPGPGLPASVVSAHEGGDAVVLLVTERKGIEDKPLRRYVEDLRSRSDVAVFTTTVQGIARYSRIAQGVDLNRAPALVIIKPGAGGADALPAATIHYGYRGPDSVRTALRDAFYKGKQLPYHPG